MSTSFPIARGVSRIVVHLLLLMSKLPWWLTAIVALIGYSIFDGG